MAVVETTIEGRYQIIARIASGGMGEVYRAHDAVLARDVAVKVLHANLAGDRGFVERFRREARAAAILNHPNIVGVYDWGSHDGTYFMVMEYVQGLNLRSLLTEYGRLEPAQVVEVSLQVLAALEHAHGHGIVHRDVKPENILIARDGTVKVADFGLARAYADSYVSQVEGTVTGTVQYLAPEQIQGEPADPRTDLYSVGVVMFELLTGRTPFSGETSLAIAYQHLTGRIPAPSHVLPTLSPALDRPILQATARDREHRPPGARALADEIARLAPSLPPATPVGQMANQIPTADLIPEDRAPTVTIPRSLSPHRRRIRALRRVLIALLAVLVVTAGGWGTWVYAIPHYRTVPRVLGLDGTTAQRHLQAAGLNVAQGSAEHSHTVPVGLVVRTDPAAGARVKKDSVVTVVLSLGPQLVPVPDVTGQDYATAKSNLEKLGFTVIQKQAYDDQVPEGEVISQSAEPGTKLEPNYASVTLRVSQGPAPVALPDVTGQSYDVAFATLTGKGFKVKEKEQFDDQVPNGDVISMSPAGGTTQPKGSTVTLTVSKGPETFALKDFTGETREQAVAELGALGLQVQIVTLPGTPPPDTVVFQDPPAGTIVHSGDTVTLYVTAP